MSRKATHYRSILKASSLIGGASLINLLIGMVRVKFVAVLLGPAGVGLMGTYVTITTLVNTVSGMGISTSGVRQISESYGAGNQESISRTVTAVRRTVWLTGALGCS
jgi:PST family polysaccharide transporter